MEEIFDPKKKIWNKDGDEEEVELWIQNKIVALYFSAGWCPPCRQFTPLLAQFYEEAQERNAPFTVIFVSFDKSEKEMLRYMKEAHADWLAVPYGDELVSILKERFRITSVPKLVILKPDGEVISLKGRKDIQEKGIAALRFWLDNARLSSSALTVTSKKDISDSSV